MSILEAFENETRSNPRNGKVEKWFLSLDKTDQDGIREYARRGGARGWKAAMYRVAMSNGLDAKPTTFKEFLQKLELNENYLKESK